MSINFNVAAAVIIDSTRASASAVVHEFLWRSGKATARAKARTTVAADAVSRGGLKGEDSQAV